MKIFPSIMAKNQQELDSILQKLKGVSRTLHLDVVDGKYAPNHSLDFKFRVPPQYKYNVHVMVKNPQTWIRKHLSKFDLFIPAFDALKDKTAYIQWMKEKGRKIAFSVSPETSLSAVKPYLQQIDIILILTVHPGFYGAKYLPAQLKKVQQVKKINPHLKVFVDGHINPNTIKAAFNAGADGVVSGSFISQSDHPTQALRALRLKLE